MGRYIDLGAGMGRMGQKRMSTSSSTTGMSLDTGVVSRSIQAWITRQDLKKKKKSVNGAQRFRTSEVPIMKDREPDSEKTKKMRDETESNF